MRDGVTIAFRKYGDAKPYLLSRLGPYCSYCEARFADGLHVEHMLPKNEYEDLLLSHDNFLLSCFRCNSFKNRRQAKDAEGGSAAEDLARYFWPDRDSTHLAFRYRDNGLIEPAPELDSAARQVAAGTLHMFALDKTAKDEDPMLVSDRDGNAVRQGDPRFRERLETWARAVDLRGELEGAEPNNVEFVIEAISTIAKSRGHFSIWMTVFGQFPEVRQALLAVFPGTAADCFGPGAAPVPRPGGRP